MIDEVYEPQEDSYLLEKYVSKLAKGMVLDIGTGSGIQALAASKVADFVVAVDINQKALEYCNNSLRSDKILCLKSDLFSFFESKIINFRDGKFKGISDRKESGNKFDTIIFNAPYLPEDENDKNLALDGGKGGYEIIERFFDGAKNFLSDDGIILLIFSSFTCKEKVDSIISEKDYNFEMLEKIHVFFEDIFCYKICYARKQ